MDDETPLTMELAQVSNSWRKLYKSSKKYLRVNLHPGEAQYSYDPNTERPESRGEIHQRLLSLLAEFFIGNMPVKTKRVEF